MSFNLRRVFALILILIVIIALFYIFVWERVGKLIIKLSQWQITDTMTLSVVSAVNDVIASMRGKATDIIIENGRVIAETTDTKYINLFQTALVERLYETIPDGEQSVIHFPLGSVLGTGIFSGVFPSIPVKINSITNIDYKINDELLSSGVNQTLHRITISLTIELSILVPGYEGLCEVFHEAVISETLISGDVPYSIVK